MVRSSRAFGARGASTRERRRLGVAAGERAACRGSSSRGRPRSGSPWCAASGRSPRPGSRARSRPRSGGSGRRRPRPRSPRSSGCRSRWPRSAATPGRSSTPCVTQEAWTLGKLSSITRATASVRRYWNDVSSSPASAVFEGWKVQAMKAVKPPVRSCSSRRCSRWSMRSSSVSTWPNIMVAVVRMPEPVRGLHHLEPLRGRALGDADDAAHAVGQDLGAAARDRVEPGGHQPPQRLLERRASRPARCAAPRPARGRGSRSGSSPSSSGTAPRSTRSRGPGAGRPAAGSAGRRARSSPRSSATSSCFESR